MRLCLVFFITLVTWGDVLFIDVPISEYSISDNTIVVEDGAYIHAPGAPNVPCRKLTIALPPGAIFESIEFYGTRKELGTFTIAPAPPALPFVNEESVFAKIQESYAKIKDIFYSLDKLYPETYGTVLSKGGLRKYTVVDVVCYHFAYKPVSQMLYYTPNIRIEIHYTMPSSETERAKLWRGLMDDITFDAIAKEAIYNWQDAQIWYHTDTTKRADGYTIIIPSALETSVDALVAYRQCQGFQVNIITKDIIKGLSITKQ